MTPWKLGVLIAEHKRANEVEEPKGKSGAKRPRKR